MDEIEFEFTNIRNEISYDTVFQCGHLFFVPKKEVKDAPEEPETLFYVFCKDLDDEDNHLLTGRIVIMPNDPDKKHVFKALHNADDVMAIGAITSLIIGEVLYALNKKYRKGNE